ncbi:hypothetical protein CHLRE_01g041667v5 [Chlamydomonas reinhardtii]|uniref:Uncharacterized protein n=1 Tax=Chlamydomonas reinhardtii TaxID=3055 RepID=A0A2K3E7G8_CHLRE|nr:uncharacterized protein CHLRE_01g041667v5 [Chlamydomonas reinhardtii]PNW88724.1 hypothetical protein CHLRE_01g041667v5 [Chlamydomonas reinhardtii]
MCQRWPGLLTRRTLELALPKARRRLHQQAAPPPAGGASTTSRRRLQHQQAAPPPGAPGGRLAGLGLAGGGDAVVRQQPAPSPPPPPLGPLTCATSAPTGTAASRSPDNTTSLGLLVMRLATARSAAAVPYPSGTDTTSQKASAPSDPAYSELIHSRTLAAAFSPMTT